VKKKRARRDLMVVVYLPKKIEGRGPLDGSAPGAVAVDVEKRGTGDSGVPRDGAEVVECAAHSSKGQSETYG